SAWARAARHNASGVVRSPSSNVFCLRARKAARSSWLKQGAISYSSAAWCNRTISYAGTESGPNRLAKRSSAITPPAPRVYVESADSTVEGVRDILYASYGVRGRRADTSLVWLVGDVALSASPRSTAPQASIHGSPCKPTSEARQVTLRR